MDRKRKMLIAAGAAVVVAGATTGVVLAVHGGDSHPAAAPTPTSSPRPSAHPVEHQQSTCPLTGRPPGKSEKVDRVAVAVKIDNVPEAQPQAGLDHTDLVVQETVEGGLTRLFAVFQCGAADTVGPIRSARTSDGALLHLLHGAVFAYSGANPAAIRPWTGSVNAALISWGASPGLFRLDHSRPAPHDVFGSTARLRTTGSHRLAGLNAPRPIFQYGQPAVSGAKVKMASIRWPAASAAWTWGGKAWQRIQDGRPDMLTDGNQVTATNVVIMSIRTEDTGIRDVLGNPSPDDVTTGHGEAWVLRDGRLFHGVWIRRHASDGYTFKDNKGKPLPLHPGNTWLELLPGGGSPSFEK
jgi:hypothetical protein